MTTLPHSTTMRRRARPSRLRAALAGAAGLVAIAAALPCLADAAAGKALATAGAPNGVAPCASCHGANGEGQPQAGFPRLAGQVHAYLVKQLEDFRDGRRHNPVMEPIARALTAKQVNDAADYFSGLPRVAARTSFDDAPKGAGERIALRGDWSQRVPACFKCHGENGAGIPPHFPAIAGQGEQYAAKQIRDWKSGARANDPQGLMKSVADKLPDSDIDAVARWLASIH